MSNFYQNRCILQLNCEEKYLQNVRTNKNIVYKTSLKKNYKHSRVYTFLFEFS